MNKRYAIVFCLVICGVLTGLQSRLQVPVAELRPDTLNIHRVSFIDNWSWLKDRQDPQLRQLLREEERYADRVMRPSRRLGKRLYKEFRALEDKRYVSYPYRLGDYLYFYQQPSNKAYPIHYRRENLGGSKERVILDENKLARRNEYFYLDQFEISPNGRYLAYTTDTRGDENYRLYIKDLERKITLDTGITYVSECLWIADSQTLLITRMNNRFQTDTLWSYNLASREELLIYTEADPGFDLSLYHSAARELIFVLASAKNTTEAFYLRNRPSGIELKSLASRTNGHRYYPDYFEGLFYIQSNKQNRDCSIYVCSELNTAVDTWRVMVPGLLGSPITDFLIFDKALVVKNRHQGFERLELYDRRGNSLLYSLPVPEISDYGFWHNPDPNADYFYYTRESELTPPQIIRHSFSSRSDSLVYAYKPPKELFLERFRSDVRQVRLPDGRSVPLRLTYHRDLDLSSPNPLILSAYGAYGDSEDPYFSSTNIPILERGVVLATAHVRGGGEYGIDWYEGGRLHNKMNSFTDFIACMDYLIANKISSPRKLAISGASAGGLLVGAVLNMAPEKMKLAIADVPFVDMINTMLDPDLPLTIQEYEEWGDPSDRNAFNYMLQYSPYDNVTAQDYPEILINAGWMDARVGYWEGLKWAQKLRSQNSADTKVVYRLMDNQGHGGSGNRLKNLRDQAQRMAYALWLLGINK